MTKLQPVRRVAIVEDDADTREMLGMLFDSVGIESVGLRDGMELLQAADVLETVSAIVLDLRMPRMGGTTLLKRLVDEGSIVATVVLTGHADVGLAIQCMKLGAVDMLEKPVDDQALLDAVQDACAITEARRAEADDLRRARRSLADLTPRRLDVARRIARGDANKVIAADLGISIRTVEIHRHRVMKTMNADSVAELVRQMVQLERAGLLEDELED